MDYLALSKTKLFYKIPSDQIKVVLHCLKHRTQSYHKGEKILELGEKVEEFGLVLKGAVLIENNDYWGNRSILAMIEEYQIFAESYAFTQERLKVRVIASEETEVLFLNTQSLTSICHKSCNFHTQLIQNLLAITSSHNIRLSQRILNTSAKTIRGRLVSYLSHQVQVNGSNKFSIPLNRQELADYLNVDRSALSKELGKMRDEGLLSFKKNDFHLF